MALNEREVMAALRVLVGVAKADGVIHEAERAALEAALAGVQLPEGMSLDKLLQETVDVGAQLALLESAEAKGKVYEAAVSLAYAEREGSTEEKKLLEQIRSGLGIAEEEATLATRLAREIGETLVPGAVEPVTDPEQREKAVDSDIRKYSVIAAALGAFPIPVADLVVNLGVVGLHTKMFHDIGRSYGFTTTKEQVKNLIGGVGVGTGARVAVVSLAKFIPGWGSVVGATTNFVATYALGKVAKRYYTSQGQADLKDLKDLFASAQKEGRVVYDQNRAEIESKANASKARLEALATQLRQGSITPEEYQRQVADLG
ncbi:MAG: hypothetical protein HYY01_03810 [Chloroflexi bacterium]|nr:hypothetical protein [Chloroflexota bacterium]